MEQFLIQIAQSIKQNGLACSNQGLLNGNTGMCIFFYHLAHEKNNPDYEYIADDLLEKVMSNLGTSTPTDFENGLAGIGWGIEYLIQNKFAEGNADEILEEVDNKVFKALNEDYHSSFELVNGITGYLFYLINRLNNKKATFSIAQQINRELLILTINKIDELVTTQFSTITKEVHFDLFWRFPFMLLGLAEAFKLNIYNEKINCMVKQWLPYFDAYIPSMHINRLYLAVALKHIYSLMPDKRLEKQIQILLFATDFEVLKKEVDYNFLNLRNGWPGVALLLNVATKKLPNDWTNHHLIDQTYHSIMERQENMIENHAQHIAEENLMQFGLSLGLSGIGLLGIICPGILTSNCLTHSLKDDPCFNTSSNNIGCSVSK